MTKRKVQFLMKKVCEFLLGLVLFLVICYLISIPFGLTKKWHITIGIYVSGYIVNEYLKRKAKEK